MCLECLIQYDFSLQDYLFSVSFSMPKNHHLLWGMFYTLMVLHHHHSCFILGLVLFI